MSIVKIENVRVLDPIQKTDSVQTVYIQDGKLVAAVDQVEQTIDGQGKWLMPTMVDLCARLREPGQQQHGTLKSEGKGCTCQWYFACHYPTRLKANCSRQWRPHSWLS